MHSFGMRCDFPARCGSPAREVRRCPAHRAPAGEGLAAEKQEPKFPSWLLATDPGSHQERSRGVSVGGLGSHNWAFCWCTGHSWNPQTPPLQPPRGHREPQERFSYSPKIKGPPSTLGCPQPPTAPLPGGATQPEPGAGPFPAFQDWQECYLLNRGEPESAGPALPHVWLCMGYSAGCGTDGGAAGSPRGKGGTGGAPSCQPGSGDTTALSTCPELCPPALSCAHLS